MNDVTPIPERPVVAIVGRPNVGKSTLFNRLVGSRRAIVEDVPGVTRDRHYADAEWEGRPFTAIDTGGFELDARDTLHARVREQAERAIAEADLVLFVVDGREALTATDQEIARHLRRGDAPVILAVNKIDSARTEEQAPLAECWALGFEMTIPVSAEHGRGMQSLLEALEPHLPVAPPDLEDAAEDDAPRVCRVAIVGRPNVGKSTFINRLLGEERFVASEIPGTTTDPIDALIGFRGKEYVLTDTAGIRRKRSIEERLEQFSVHRALSTIDRSDVTLLLTDASEPAVEQDARIAGLTLEKGRALAIIANKWDLVSRSRDPAEFQAELRRKLPFAGFVPVVLCSALTGEAVDRAFGKVEELYQHACARLPTPQLNDFLQTVCSQHPPPLVSGKRAKPLYIAQVGVRPPTFAVSCSWPEAVTDDWRRFLMNRMRDTFGLKVPIRLLFKARSRR